MGWLTVLDYVLAFIACGMAALSDQRNARFWAVLCLLMLLLGAAKATAADLLLADLIREPMRDSALYGDRQGYQEVAIAGMFAVAALTGALLLYRKRAARMPVKAAKAGVLAGEPIPTERPVKGERRSATGSAHAGLPPGFALDPLPGGFVLDP